MDGVKRDLGLLESVVDVTRVANDSDQWRAVVNMGCPYNRSNTIAVSGIYVLKTDSGVLATAPS